ncbi:MAG: DUF6599 family protein [Candidatus Eisenbacteria bacterium]
MMRRPGSKRERGGTEKPGRGPFLPLLCFAALACVSFLALPARPAEPNKERIMDLPLLMPEVMGGEAGVESETLYDRETIFRYMNGAGEVYLSYGFRALLVRRLPGPAGDTLTVELYDMGSSADAFGIFSRNRGGEEAGVGQGSEYRSGYLLFWKDRCFATIWTSRDSPESKKAVFETGRAIAARITEEGALPDLLSTLPEQGLAEGSIRYFHRHTDLNQHYFLSDDNILDLGERTDAVLAAYAAEEGGVLLLVVRYPREGDAEKAHERFVALFLKDGRGGAAAPLEDGTYAGSARVGRHLIAVFDAPGPEIVDQLLAAARGRLEGGAR